MVTVIVRTSSLRSPDPELVHAASRRDRERVERRVRLTDKVELPSLGLLPSHVRRPWPFAGLRRNAAYTWRR